MIFSSKNNHFEFISEKSEEIYKKRIIKEKTNHLKNIVILLFYRIVCEGQIVFLSGEILVTCNRDYQGLA